MRHVAFHASRRDAAASNYLMPALSPTMTEGNIATWRVKEGDSFTAGDVILEIETDKATMDVEAQDDGKLFKIMQGDGAKGVQVGERIAVMAEENDDLSSLEVPAEDKGAIKGQEAKKEEPVAQQNRKRAASHSHHSLKQRPNRPPNQMRQAKAERHRSRRILSTRRSNNSFMRTAFPALKPTKYLHRGPRVVS